MPTPLSRPVVRRVQTVQGRPLVVTLTADGIVFREPRRRRSVILQYGFAWLQAEKLAAAVASERKRRTPVRRGKV